MLYALSSISNRHVLEVIDCEHALDTDQDGMLTLHRAFDGVEYLDEVDFVALVFKQLAATQLPHNEQVTEQSSSMLGLSAQIQLDSVHANRFN